MRTAIKISERKGLDKLTQKQRMSGSEAVVRSLIGEDVTYIFGYPGGAIMPVYDMFYDFKDQIKHVLVRHEQGATHAAQGYARATGKAGVCIATSGPGATNLITGIADAQIDSTPLVCITGQVASHLLGTDAFQETDVLGISMPVTKWNYQVTSAEEIPEAIAKAFYIAQSGRPGPVLIDITKDAQFGELDFDYKKCTKIRSYFPKSNLDLKQVERAAQLINNAEKPLLLFGNGVLISGAEEVLKKVVETSDIPAASTLLGLSALPTDHPKYVGMLGMHGNYAPNVLTNECDVLIAVGMRFDDRVTGDLSTYAKQAKVVHFEIDPSEVDKNVKTEVAVVADAKLSLEALLPLLKRKNNPNWKMKFDELRKLEFSKVVEKDLFPTSDELTMGEAVHLLTKKTEGSAILVTDVGQHQMVASRYFNFKESRSNITSGGLGTMGFALPAALGAKLGQPNKEVIAVIGDGGFQMTLQELGTVMQTGVALKIVILNNSFLGMVRQWQELFFDKRYSSTEMTNPDFQAIAQGFNIASKKVEARIDLDGAIEELLNHNGSFLLEVVVAKEHNVFPMIPTGASVSDMLLEPNTK